MVRLVSMSDAMGFSASTLARARVSSIRSSGAHTFQARPMARHSSALNHSELSSIHAASWRPRSIGKVKLLAASGATARSVKGQRTLASVDMNTRSAYPRMVAPMPRARPLTAQRSGLGKATS